MSDRNPENLVFLDGRQVKLPLVIDADIVVVGSGPAGAVVAAHLAASGLDVVVLEEGGYVPPEHFEASGVRAMAALYRDMGTSMLFGNCSMPYLQGVAVGGTSVINGAICWEMPKNILEEWVQADAALEKTFDYQRYLSAEQQVEKRLNVAPTDDAIAGRKNLLLGIGANVLGVASRPIRRNVVDCKGSGRCIQGCPHGAKLSMDKTFLPDAVSRGARIYSNIRVERVLIEHEKAVGVLAKTKAGAVLKVRSKEGVVLAASAIQTPVLLQESGITQGPVGQGLCGHPGVSVTARFDGPARNYSGATQGHEVTGWRGEGLKIEALGFDLSILASRLPGYGQALMKNIEAMDHFVAWGAAIRAFARGQVRSVLGKPVVSYSLTNDDVVKTRHAVRRLGETFFAAGATEVYPGVPGFDKVVTRAERIREIENEAPLRANAYSMSITHLFGTARMGSDANTSVVRPDFRHHAVKGLFVADSSVFPTNLGVNPQIAIMAVAQLCAQSIVAQ